MKITPAELVRSIFRRQDVTVPKSLCRIVLADDEPPEWIELIPAGGVVEAADGRSFKNSDPHAVVAAFAKRTTDAPIDYEHSTELKAPVGEEAPAAGWIVALEVREGAIFGRVEWTVTGALSLTKREYRYISPAFKHTKAGQVLEIISAGLTNRPALTQLPELAHEQPLGEETMLDKEILEALGLAPDSSVASVVVAIKDLKRQGASDAEALASARAAVVSTEEQLSLAQAQADKPDVEKFVPRADHEAMLLRAETAEAKIKEVEKSSLEADIDTAIKAALLSKKITPATETYHRECCAQEGGLARFQALYVEKTPVVTPDSGLDGKPVPGAGESTKLTAEERRVAELCGLEVSDLETFQEKGHWSPKATNVRS